MSHSSYLEVIFDKTLLRERIAEAVEALKDVHFDAIAVRGTSGLTFGSILAFTMDKHIIVSRKPKDMSHSPYEVEIPRGIRCMRYIVVDDFICSGRTLQDTIKSIVDNGGPLGKSLTLVGVFCYGGAGYESRYIDVTDKSIADLLKNILPTPTVAVDWTVGAVTKEPKATGYPCPPLGGYDPTNWAAECELWKEIVIKPKIISYSTGNAIIRPDVSGSYLEGLVGFASP